MPTKPSPPPLTPRFERVLALDGPTFGRPRPTPEELEAIRGVLAEGASAAARLKLARAMAIAVDSAPDTKTAWLIARILMDDDADAALRRQAAALLGDIGLRGASKALAEALVDAGPGLETVLLQSLAKCGDADAARAIAARPKTRSARLARLRDFARATIAYRSGAPVDERAERALLPIGTPLAVGRPSAQEATAVIDRLRGSSYGLRLDPEQAYSFQCGNSRHLVLLASELGRGRLAAALAARQRIAGIVAMQDEKGSTTYLARRLIVTRPGRNGIDVAVVGTDGEPDLLGSLRTEGQRLAIGLRSHGAARTPIVVDGFADDSGLMLDVRVFGGGASVKRSGDVDPAAG
jgi:hypothetical protein